MWLYISRRLRQWLILSVLLPLVSRLAGRLSARIEHGAGGPTKLSRGLGAIGSFGRRRAAQKSREVQANR